ASRPSLAPFSGCRALAWATATLAWTTAALAWTTAALAWTTAALAWTTAALAWTTAALALAVAPWPAVSIAAAKAAATTTAAAAPAGAVPATPLVERPWAPLAGIAVAAVVLGGLGFLTLGGLEQRAPRQVHAALSIDLGDQDLNLVADVHHVLDSRDTV